MGGMWELIWKSATTFDVWVIGVSIVVAVPLLFVRLYAHLPPTHWVRVLVDSLFVLAVVICLAAVTKHLIWGQ